MAGVLGRTKTDFDLEEWTMAAFFPAISLLGGVSSGCNAPSSEIS